jgi:hypothetical protein
MQQHSVVRATTRRQSKGSTHSARAEEAGSKHKRVSGQRACSGTANTAAATTPAAHAPAPVPPTPGTDAQHRHHQPCAGAAALQWCQHTARLRVCQRHELSVGALRARSPPARTRPRFTSHEQPVLLALVCMHCHAGTQVWHRSCRAHTPHTTHHTRTHAPLLPSSTWSTAAVCLGDAAEHLTGALTRTRALLGTAAAAARRCAGASGADSIASALHVVGGFKARVCGQNDAGTGGAACVTALSCV